MKMTVLQLLLLSLCAMNSTSLPLESEVTMQQAKKPTTQLQPPTVDAVVSGEAKQAVSVAVSDGSVSAAGAGAGERVAGVDAERHAVDASLLMPLLPADEVPSRDGKCAKIGEYCNLSEVCCTHRCLFYAMKCVT